jgi:Domain of unknown function (DUF4389)
MMTDNSEHLPGRRRVWVRGFYMLVLAILWHVAEVVLFGVAILQFVFALAGGPNERLQVFGVGLARYLRQAASYLTFASDELPFPFSDWPVA